MDAEIAMALNPEQKTIRLLELYVMKISKCLDRIHEMEQQASEIQLEQLDIVYGKLERLGQFIGELLLETRSK
ncbi:hypothetical protein D3C87_1582230 [compost metagenome]